MNASIPLACLLIAAQAVQAQPPHVPLNSACGITWYGLEYEPPAPSSLTDLTPDALKSLKAHLTERLGSEYASQLSLAGGQIIDRTLLREKVPDSINFEWRPPKYDLHFHFPANSDPQGFCASVELDDDGTVLKPITLPNLRAFPQRGEIVAASEATEIAARNGVPVNYAERNLYYFPDSDTLEYEFSFVVRDDGLNITYSHFHVVAHDVSQTHWRQSSAIR